MKPYIRRLVTVINWYATSTTRSAKTFAGRPPRAKQSKRSFEASLAISEVMNRDALVHVNDDQPREKGSAKRRR